MRVVIEIDNENELKKAERFMRYLNPSEIIIKDKMKKIKKFFDYANKTSVSVKKVIIPQRIERNAR